MRSWVVFGVVGACALGAGVGVTVGEDKSDSRPAAEVFDFTLTDSAGKSHKLFDYKDKKARYVVLEWTCTTCPYVKPHYENGSMQALVKRFADKGVVWLAIDSNKGVTAESLETWRSQHKIAHPILIDGDGAVGQKYGAKTTPHLYVLDLETGKRIYEGAIDDNPRGSKEKVVNYVDLALTAALAGNPVETARTKPYG
ncbi:MAG: redoxin domain-containing protein [Planctomycetota bacterium]